MRRFWQHIQSWKSRWTSWFKRRWWVISIVSLLLIGYLRLLPDPLFDDPLSTVLTDRNEHLLGARIASDGQWRFPPLTDTIPHTFEKAITTFEDKRFYVHPGVDPLALLRAIRLNISQGKIVSGGSTLSMQVIRMSRKNPPRTIWEKLFEMVLATRLELGYSKNEILLFYASHAPFGGNVVGLDAAAWKYFGRNPAQLSWAEAATLAVLPNAPALIHPGKNRETLLRKRNRLLGNMLEEDILDSTEWELALLEPLPEKPLRLPALAPHLLDRIQQANQSESKSQTKFVSTLDQHLQIQASQILKQHYLQLRENGIHNASVLIMEVETGDVRAYLGNTPCNSPDHGCAVDIIPALRSTGSIMKPFLYASMIQEGELLPDQLVPDVPTYYSGYHPTNFDKSYQGAVPASKALSRSLNVPIVRMLQTHGIARFHNKLQELGMTSLTRPSSDYGLSLILGGAEASLWEMAGIYAGMARGLTLFPYYNGKYEPRNFRPPNLLKYHSQQKLPVSAFHKLRSYSPLEAGPIWSTFEAMVNVSRPELDRQWEQFASSNRIAWKTGTSYGYRDAWAIGCTPEYVVAVWVGNADGEGRPNLIGGKAAAPIMLQMFDLLPLSGNWFARPYDNMVEMGMCRRSGYQAFEFCLEVDTVWIPRQVDGSGFCPYHKMVQLDASKHYRVNSHCESPFDMSKEIFFILPPVQEAYFRIRQPFYKPLPPFREDCLSGIQNKRMELIYPRHNARIFVPVDLDGALSSTIFEAAHLNPTATIYWHLDEIYLGKTKDLHQMSLQPSPGFHSLHLMDEYGESLEQRFEVLAKNN
ncbi:MAG: penicillin-binding protein 1C [Bacteroidota bacterium]